VKKYNSNDMRYCVSGFVTGFGYFILIKDALMY
jgi:hypothetical protein